MLKLKLHRNVGLKIKNIRKMIKDHILKKQKTIKHKYSTESNEILTIKNTQATFTQNKNNLDKPE